MHPLGRQGRGAAKTRKPVLQGSSGRTQRGLTPRSTGPATASAVSPVRGTWCIISYRAYGACLHGPVSSNVRPRRAAFSVFTTLLLAAASSAFSLRKVLQDQFVEASRKGSAFAPGAEPRLDRTRRQVSSLKSVLQDRAGARPALGARSWLEQERHRQLQRLAHSGDAWQRHTKPCARPRSTRPQSGQDNEPAHLRRSART